MTPENTKAISRIIAAYCSGRFTPEQALAKLSNAFADESIRNGKMLPEAMEDAGYEYETETGRWVKK